MTTTSTSAIDAVLANSNGPRADPRQQSETDRQSGLVNQNMFLQLLVAQLKNQNPLEPADGLQFVTQLAQFTTLEQSTQMRSDISAIRDLVTFSVQQQALGTEQSTDKNSTDRTNTDEDSSAGKEAGTTEAS